MLSLFTYDQFIATGGYLEVTSDQAEVTDFDPTPISFTIPQSSRFLVNVPLNSIIQDTINEANESLILTLDVVNPEDAMVLDLSRRAASILFIRDDDSKKDTTAGVKIVAYDYYVNNPGADPRGG
jgi:hypothetical protein